MTRVISFSSGKGGVGKTTLVANMGHLWAKRGKRTLLLDGDWSLGKLSITLGVKTQSTIEKVLEGKVRISDAIQQVAPDLFLLAAPSGILGFEELSEESRTRLFYELEQLSGQFDLILFDHSSGVNWGVLQFAAASHQHVIVTTAEPTSYTDAYAIMKLLSKRFSVRDFCLLVTSSQAHAETDKVITRFIDVTRSHLDVRLRLLDIFPWEPKLAESIRRRQPFVGLYPSSDFTVRLERACQQLEEVGPTPSHGLHFFYENQMPVR